ncbi:hypothetical protein Golob_009615, partial [Gossypium lobatum]|nr:hypothetical protein [Gossypium lobatum]
IEDSIADLSLEYDEDETIQIGAESSESEALYANCFVGMFLTSSVVNFQAMRLTLANMLIHDLPLGFMSEAVARQLGSFIEVFLEYDASMTQLGYKRIMRLKVRIDVRKPLKKKKKLTLPN